MKNVAWKMDEPFDGIVSRVTGKLDAHVTLQLLAPMPQVYDVQEEVIRKVSEATFFVERLAEIEGAKGL
tara:strand:- start:5434 stop:5640 length:207 start_codon:yes stop_codon:yes gene_type:complete